MLKKLLTATLWIFLALPATGALAQTGTVAGTVTDSTSGEVLPGVSVRVADTQLGGATGGDGQFEIASVPTGQQTIVASFVGYQTQEVPVQVSEGETTQVNIALAASTVALQDVVVTALGVEREARSIGYSVSEVEGEELAEVPETNFISALQGKVPGANFFQSNSLGGSTRIVLRGPNSVTGNNQPLIVVDGVVLDNENFQTDVYDYGNAAQIINPENVQSVSVLKGPAAAALYGSRGANGAIQITTKSGAGTEGVGVTVNTSLTASSIYGLPDYQNEFGGGYQHPFQTLDGDFLLDDSDDQHVVSYGEDESWGPRLDDGRMVREWFSWDDVNGLNGQVTPWESHPDNVNNYFRTGLESNSTVSFSHSLESFNYRLGLGNISARGTYPNQTLSRRQLNFKGSADLTDRLTAQVTANYVDSEAQGRVGLDYGSGLNPFLQFTHFGQRQVDLSEGAPLTDIRRANGQQRGWNWDGISGAQAARLRFTDNPFWIRQQSFEEDDTERIFGNVRVAYELMDDVTLSGRANVDHYVDRRQERVASGSQGQPDYDENIFEVQEVEGSARLGYDGQLTDDLSLSTFGATSYRYNSRDENGGSTNDGLVSPGVYTLENSVGRPAVFDFFRENAVFSVYGSANAGWRDLLYLTATARNDWSSTLPADNNSYFYPSVSGSFVFSSLPALQEQDVLSFGKLRLSFAQVGSDTGPYQLTRTFPTGTPFEGRPVQGLPASLNNDELEAETTTSYEIGTQLDFFNNRLGLDATYYYEKTTDQILPVDVSRATGFASVLVNAGELTNQGAELSMTATPVLTDDFQWDVSVNWAKNVNEVVELAEGLQAFDITSSQRTTPAFGPRIQARVGEPYGSIFGTGFVRDANGEIVLGSNGIPLTTDAKVIGNYQPDWTGAASTRLSYKGFTASVSIDGQRGGDIYSLTNLFGNFAGLLQHTVDNNIRALGVVPEGVFFPNGEPEGGYSSEAGQEFTTQINNPRSYFNTAAFVGPREAVVFDASYIKLREVRLGYTLPQRWLESIPSVRRLTVSLIGSNLATLFKNAPNIDPSYAVSSGNLQGFEEGQNPPKRSYGFSLRLDL